MGLFHQPKRSPYFCPAEMKPVEPGQTLLPLPYILPAETPTAAGAPVVCQENEQIGSSALPHKRSAGMSHWEQAGNLNNVSCLAAVLVQH